MKGLKSYLKEQHFLEERVLRKGAVAVYAAQGKRYGDEASRKYQAAKQALRSSQNDQDTDQRITALMNAMAELLDGLVATRKQIGSVSAQVTSASLMN